LNLPRFSLFPYTYPQPGLTAGLFTPGQNSM
jgi:hypothetical protein